MLTRSYYNYAYIALNYAKQLIEKDFGNMAQVVYEFGFNNPSYFAGCFKKQFGILPSEYAKSEKSSLK